MKDIDLKIHQTKEKIQEKDKLKSLLLKSQNVRNQLLAKEKALKDELSSAEKYIANLEGFSLKSIVYSISGKKLEKTEEEKLKLQKIQENYREVSRDLNVLNEKIIALKAGIDELGDMENTYINLINQKKDMLNKEDGKAASILKDMEHNKEELYSRLREIKEAKDAGNALLHSLNSVEKLLQSASNWGTWDMLGGGLLATAAKHSKINQAKHEVSHAQGLIQHFQQELDDIGDDININIDIGSFLTFADYFFDGLLSDWAVQSKISTAKSKVSDAIFTVRGMLRQLEESLNNLSTDLSKLEKQITNLIENKTESGDGSF